LSLDYAILDPVRATKGEDNRLWNGLWRADKEDKINEIQRLFSAYSRISEQVIEYLKIINIFFARLDADSRTRKHVEGSLAFYLRNKRPELCTLYPKDNSTGRSKEMNRFIITAAMGGALDEMSEELMIGEDD